MRQASSEYFLGHLAPSVVGCMTLHANARANAVDVLTLGIFSQDVRGQLGALGSDVDGLGGTILQVINAPPCTCCWSL